LIPAKWSTSISRFRTPSLRDALDNPLPSAQGSSIVSRLAPLVFGIALAMPSPANAGVALPGVSRDVLAAAERLERGSEPTIEPRYSARERAALWGPGVALAAAALTVDFAASAPRHPRWDTRNHFDDAISDGLVAGSRSSRDAAAVASTVLLSLIGAGLATDVYLLRDEYAVEQSLAVALTATAATQVTAGTAKVLAGRERPYVRRCRADPRYSEDCNSGRDDNESFFSLHASQSATLASLICVRRLRRANRTWIDGLACGAAASASAATGILRIVADQHYATDVLAGWGAGALFGTALPLLFPDWSGIGGGNTSVTPLAGAGAFGLQYTSRF
jgi:membrane-associated phospholipid phosphatase